ncbi:MAG: TatD family hydrolase [Candidatus Pacebacteria bacterium]|nr:TatD family hydrolase [Candidatus Paceibacterota bacterium]
MLIDTHAHVNFNAFKDDVDEVTRRTLNNDAWMINVGSQYDTSKRAIGLSQKYPEGVYASVGLHPIHLAGGIFKTKIDTEEIEFKTREENFDYNKYKGLAKSEKVVAIGEIGLDYYYKPKTKIRLDLFKNLQKEILLKQIDLAKELNLPIIFHCRMAHDDLIQILENIKGIFGVIHCFTGNLEEAKKYLEMGFYLGLNGIIFKLNLDEVIKNTPLDKILVETDCPYLTPPPMAGRNEPLYVKYVVEKIANLKNLSIEEITKITTQNAKKLFKI